MHEHSTLPQEVIGRRGRFEPARDTLVAESADRVPGILHGLDGSQELCAYGRLAGRGSVCRQLPGT